jgi:hypothetical protein
MPDFVVFMGLSSATRRSSTEHPARPLRGRVSRKAFKASLNVVQSAGRRPRSCRAQGFCADLIILVCETAAHPSGELDTSCNSLPESSTQIHGAPVITTENVALPTGDILSRGSSGSDYEVVIRMDESSQSFVGQGVIGISPLFLTGRRVG